MAVIASMARAYMLFLNCFHSKECYCSVGIIVSIKNVGWAAMCCSQSVCCKFKEGAEEGEMISGVTSKLMKIPPILLLVFIISISNRKFYDIKSTLLSSLVFSLPLLYKTFSGFEGV